MITNPAIQQEIHAFYIKMWGTSASSLQGVDLEVMRRGQILDPEKAAQLILPISHQEIDAAIKNIDSSFA